ncbi:MAG: hypothetical protein ACOH5I_08160 [Oligoflexus sp.]
MKKNMMLVAAGLMLGSSMAHAIESTRYPENTTIRPFAKRDRLLVGGLNYVSPAQLHENEGFRARFGAEMQQSTVRTGDVESELTTPQGTLELAYGWSRFTLGLGANYLSAENTGEGDLNFEESFEARKLLPQLAYTFTDNWTIGAGVEMNWLDVKEKAQTESSFDYQINRPVVGLAYTTPRFEVGLAYAAEVQETAGLDANAQRGDVSLSLAAMPTELQRAVYLPAMTTLYGRGNVTDRVSLMSSVSMARYDGNVDGAIELFDNYKTADRLAAKVLATYWTESRSHISIAADYKGAATTAIGAEEAGLGYRLVNLYGGSLEGAYSINRQAYVGLLASYTRGERNDLSNAGEQFSGKEDTTRFAGFVTVKM